MQGEQHFCVSDKYNWAGENKQDPWNGSDF